MERVVITGMGVISPIGSTLNDYWTHLAEGKSGIGAVTLFDADEEYRTRIGGEVKDFQPEQYLPLKEARRLPRFIQFAVAAAKDALKDAGLHEGGFDPERAGVAVGSGIGGIDVLERQHEILRTRGPKRVSPFFVPHQIINMAPGQISIQCGLRGPNLAHVTACATSNHSIGSAYSILSRGEADVMAAGGTEAAFTPLSYAGFCAMKAMSTRNDAPETASRPFDATRDGFVMGEGSGVLIMETLKHAEARGANVYAEMIGFGMSSDAHDMVSPPLGGSGAARSMKAAIERAGVASGEIDYINAHGTSTPVGDIAETCAIKTVFGAPENCPAVSSTKSVTGHLLGAAGAVEMIASILAVKHQTIPPTINLNEPDPECDLDYTPNEARPARLRHALSNAFGFGGHNTTVVIRAWDA
ncbi:MAG: beta-ketoacyl-ACP synthase II [Candidatus Poribacteria bacterium]|nr:beta-ketoacyl-ACP synthase II [Candidatus Poribacteria bacterium]